MKVLSLCAVLCGMMIAVPSSGRVLSVPMQVDGSQKGSIAIRNTGIGALTETLDIHENETITLADLTFTEDVPAGTEIEIWPEVEGETPPWELSGENFPFTRNVWITDERTGTRVRFDVTDIVTAWEAETIPDLGFRVRILSDEEEQQSMGAPAPAAPKGVTLTYHITAVRALEPLVPTPPHGVIDPKKVPRTEDGKRKWQISKAGAVRAFRTALAEFLTPRMSRSPRFRSAPSPHARRPST